MVVDTNLRLAGEATLFGGKGRGRWGMGDQVDFLPSTPSVVGCLRALETRVQAMQKSGQKQVASGYITDNGFLVFAYPIQRQAFSGYLC